MKWHKYLYLSLGIGIAYIIPAYADTATATTADYGKVYLSSSSATINFTTSGGLSSISGALISGYNNMVATMTYINTDNTTKIIYLDVPLGDITLKNSSYSSCSIKLSSRYYSSGQYKDIPGNGSDTFKYLYRKVTISGTCGPGTYTSSYSARFMLTSLTGTIVTTINVPITLEIVDELNTISITKNKDLNFGSLFGTAAHNVVVDYNGNRSGNTSYLLQDTANAPQAAEFTIKNEATSAKTVQIALPTSAVLSNSGQNPMNVSNFTSNQATNTNINIPANSSIVAKIGATLSVPAGQPAGEYSGNFTVTINY